MYPNGGQSLSGPFYQQSSPRNDPPLPPRNAATTAAAPPPPLPPRSPYAAPSFPPPPPSQGGGYNMYPPPPQSSNQVDALTASFSHLATAPYQTQNSQYQPHASQAYSAPSAPPTPWYNPNTQTHQQPIAEPPRPFQPPVTCPMPLVPPQQAQALPTSREPRHYGPPSASSGSAINSTQPTPSTSPWVQVSQPQPVQSPHQHTAPQGSRPPQPAPESTYYYTPPPPPSHMGQNPAHQTMDSVYSPQPTQQSSSTLPSGSQQTESSARRLIKSIFSSHSAQQNENPLPSSTQMSNPTTQDSAFTNNYINPQTNQTAATTSPSVDKANYATPLSETPHQYQPPEPHSKHAPGQRSRHARQVSGIELPVHDPPLDVVVKVEDLVLPLKGSREKLQQCPYPGGITYSVLWYFALDAPDFCVCSNCYHEHISHTKFKVHFTSGTSTSGKQVFCDFGAPRVQKLWPTVVDSNDFQLIMPFMKHRMSLPPCQGVGGVKGTQKTKWYGLSGGEIPGFVACASCYEDIILATNFSSRFTPYQTAQDDEAVWSCDIAVNFVARTIHEYSEENDWKGFITLTAHHMNLPQCEPYKMVPSDSRTWFQPRSNLPNLVICETCYLDYIKLSTLASNFEKCPDRLVQGQKEWACNMGYMGMRMSWLAALASNNYRLWFENARIFIQNPMCSLDAVKDAKWYTFKNGFSDFDLCPSCYSSLIATFGFAKYFQETTYPPGSERTCDFFPARYRFVTWMEKLFEAFNVNDFPIVQDDIMATALLKPCPRTNAIAGRDQWYGVDEWLACGECYLAAMKGMYAINIDILDMIIKVPHKACLSGLPPKWSKV